jgi:hypothetical protein
MGSLGVADSVGRDRRAAARAVPLRDAKFKREETGGFTALITAIALQHREDPARLEAGTVMLDAFYRALQQRSRK